LGRRVIYEGSSIEEAGKAVADCLERAVPGSVYSGVSGSDASLESIQSSIQIEKIPSANKEITTVHGVDLSDK